MLSYKNRLIKKEDFQKVQKKGKPIALKGSDITLKVLKRDGSTRIGFVVGKKYSTKAAKRNQIKRILREAFKEQINKVTEGFDIIVSCKKSNRHPQYNDLKKQLEEILIKNKLIKK